MANSTSTLHTLYLVISLVIAVFFQLVLVVDAADTGGFGIELIHRDSPLSPFYNSSETSSDRLRKSVRRSMSRFMHLTSTTNLESNIQSPVIPDPDEGGEYLMKLSIGTPPVEFLAIADTGSDLIWTQCKPCIQCYVQDAPLFDPKQSSTYRDTSCHSKSCKFLENTTLCGAINTNHINNCVYAYTYGDKSYTIGVLAKDTFTFDSNNNGSQPVAVPKLVFGCGHSNNGIFSRHGSGLVGLGGGPLSLVSQLGSKIDGKFSYCLVPSSENSTSKLNFGRQAIISSKKVVSTPLRSKKHETYYYLTLEGISVGDKKIKTKPLNDTIRSQGNIVIDSGTTFTLLDGELYTKIESAIRATIDAVPTQDPNGTFKLCYDITKLPANTTAPQITFHFTGADLHLNDLNTILEPSKDLVCLAMLPTDQGLSIFGNVAQMNFQVEYDLVGRKVSFAPADCTKF